MKFLKDNRILEIKEAVPEEASEILNYLNQIDDESNYKTLDESGIERTEEQEKQILKESFETEKSAVFIARVDDQIVSVSSIQKSNIVEEDNRVTLDMSVLKDYTNIGVGTHVLNYALNYCRMTKEIATVDLVVKSDQSVAIKLYKKLGFKQTGRKPKTFMNGDQYVDSIIMELVL